MNVILKLSSKAENLWLIKQQLYPEKFIKEEFIIHALYKNYSKSYKAYIRLNFFRQRQGLNRIT